MIQTTPEAAPGVRQTAKPAQKPAKAPSATTRGRRGSSSVIKEVHSSLARSQEQAAITGAAAGGESHQFTEAPAKAPEKPKVLPTATGRIAMHSRLFADDAGVSTRHCRPLLTQKKA